MSKQRLISRVALAAAMIAPGMVLASGDVTDIQTRVDKGWELVWQDEFEGKDVDESKWSWERNCWGGGNNELQCYTDRVKNSFIEDGKLVIRAYKETFRGLADVEESGTKEKRTLPYTSARMRTLNKGDFKFGRIEVRAKLPAGQGIWPAIWMLPSDWNMAPGPAVAKSILSRWSASQRKRKIKKYTVRCTTVVLGRATCSRVKPMYLRTQIPPKTSTPMRLNGLTVRFAGMSTTIITPVSTPRVGIPKSKTMKAYGKTLRAMHLSTNAST